VPKQYVRKQGKEKGFCFSRPRTVKVDGTTRPSHPKEENLAPRGFRFEICLVLTDCTGEGYPKEKLQLQVIYLCSLNAPNFPPVLVAVIEIVQEL